MGLYNTLVDFFAIRKPKSSDNDKGRDDRPDLPSIPGGRSSIADDNAIDITGSVQTLTAQYGCVNIDFAREVIPIIRALYKYNEDVSQVIDNIISLGNTGHKVFFDRNVPADQVDLMRNHLENRRRKWAPGQAGMHGIINKMFAQLLVGGALSTEWIPSLELDGIQNVGFINPESIVWKKDKAGIAYKVYQKVKSSFSDNKRVKDGLVELNQNTYQYFALNGDTDSPYGFPPYMPVISKVETQASMNKNIDYIVDTMGLVGFLEALISKPDDMGGKNSQKYENSLESLLTEAKGRLKQGMKDGIVVGFKDDHEFNFNSAAKNFDGVTKLYENNEIQLASALKHDAALMGRGYATSETQINIVFMKMLSQLRNIQNIVKQNVEFGYSLELRLAGYNFDYLKVQFARSTLQDDYKYQQAEEIKVRNVQAKLILGIIDQEQAADELGYENAAEVQALVPYEVLAGGTDPAAIAAKADRAAGKTADKKKTRSNNKPNPKSK